jgi:AcrR family transcriptional regulator
MCAASQTPSALTDFVHGRVPRAVREQQIVGVAEELFAERGYHEVSMEEIARRVGITKPVVYDYFGSKEGLYLACLGRAGDRLYARMEAAVRSEETPDRQLHAGALAFFGFAEEHREAWTVLFEEVPGRSGELVAKGAAIREQQAGLITRLMLDSARDLGVDPDPSEVEATAHALVGAGEALAMWWRAHPEIGKETVALRLVNFAVPGLNWLLGEERWEP